MATASEAFAVPFARLAPVDGPTLATSAAVTALIPNNFIRFIANSAPAKAICMACAAFCSVEPFLSDDDKNPAIWLPAFSLALNTLLFKFISSVAYFLILAACFSGSFSDSLAFCMAAFSSSALVLEAIELTIESKAPAMPLMPANAPSNIAEVTAPKSDVLVFASSSFLLYASSEAVASSVAFLAASAPAFLSNCAIIGA